MKNLLVVAVMFLATISFTANANKGEIKFSKKSWEEVKKQAKEENKLIFVDAFAEWCGPCKNMAKYAFKDDDVAKFFNDNFIPFSIDMESEFGLEFDELYSITAYPTLLFIDAEGKVVKKSVGALDADALLSLGKVTLDPTSSETYKLKAEYDNGNHSVELMGKYISASLDEGVDVDTNIVEEYLSKIPEDSLTNVLPFTVFYYYCTDINSNLVLYFARNYSTFTSEWGQNAQTKLESLFVDAIVEIQLENAERSSIDKFITNLAADEEELIEYNKIVDDYLADTE